MLGRTQRASSDASAGNSDDAAINASAQAASVTNTIKPRVMPPTLPSRPTSCGTTWRPQPILRVRTDRPATVPLNEVVPAGSAESASLFSQYFA
jgi:hypothetical protein